MYSSAFNDWKKKTKHSLCEIDSFTHLVYSIVMESLITAAL